MVEAFARKAKCSGQCIRLNKQPEEAIKQASKIYCVALPWATEHDVILYYVSFSFTAIHSIKHYMHFQVYVHKLQDAQYLQNIFTQEP